MDNKSKFHYSLDQVDLMLEKIRRSLSICRLVAACGEANEQLSSFVTARTITTSMAIAIEELDLVNQMLRQKN
jgi:hypothetical protein